MNICIYITAIFYYIFRIYPYFHILAQTYSVLIWQLLEHYCCFVIVIFFFSIFYSVFLCIFLSLFIFPFFLCIFVFLLQITYKFFFLFLLYAQYLHTYLTCIKIFCNALEISVNYMRCLIEFISVQLIHITYRVIGM